jgi:hypothetical protein
MRPRQFTCRDCGTRVYCYVAAANDDDLCIECTWLRDIDDPAERDKLRRWLQERKP